MMIAVGNGLIVEMNHVTRIQFDERPLVGADGSSITGATVYQLGPTMFKLSRTQAQTLAGIS
jgi:hypothetical protein